MAKGTAYDDHPEATEADTRAGPTRAPVADDGGARRRRGRPRSPAPKERVSLRLDQDVVAAYKATGHGWQTRINETLANALGLRRSKQQRKA